MSTNVHPGWSVLFWVRTGSLFSSFRNSKIRNLGLSLTAKPQLECTVPWFRVVSSRVVCAECEALTHNTYDSRLRSFIQDTLKGHQSVVWCVDYDGNVIVSGSHDERWRFRPPPYECVQVCISPRSLFSSPFSVIVWRDGAIAHNFAKVLDGGINGIILHENVRLHLQRTPTPTHMHTRATSVLCSFTLTKPHGRSRSWREVAWAKRWCSPTSRPASTPSGL